MRPMKMDNIRAAMKQVTKGLNAVSDAVEDYFDGVEGGVSIQESSANGIDLKTQIEGTKVTLWVNGEKVYERDVKKDARKQGKT